MEVFLEISLVLVIAVVIAAIARLFRQPLIIGYILAGIVVSPYFLNLTTSLEILEVFSHIGVSLLLFIVGLSLSPKVIREVGKVSIVTGVGQIIFTSVIGFFLAYLFGFDWITSLYIAIALTFSSTIIIMKLLSDKKDLQKLYGKISVGFLLVQDLFVIVLLMLLSSLSSGIDFTSISFTNIAIVLGVVSMFVLISLYVLPRLAGFFARSQEFLFLFSVGWGLGFAAIFYYLGFSIEVGALLAGIALSVSPFHYEISSKMRPLRDFFIIMFFILLGSQMTFGNFYELLIPAILFSLFILIGNPLIVIALMGVMGYRKKVGFQAGFTVAQISEFSLILIAKGVSLGHLSQEILSLITMVGLFTIFGSTYLVMYSDKIYPYFARILSVFERRSALTSKKPLDSTPEVLLFGKNRIAHGIVDSFEDNKRDYLVIDYNPDVIKKLKKEHIPCRYGDASDEDFLEEVNFSSVKMVISTIYDFGTNMLLLRHVLHQNPDALVLITSHNIQEAQQLYDAGASYVLMPHFLGGDYAAMMLDKYKFNKKKFSKERKEHLKDLDQKKSRGHEHPSIDFSGASFL